MKFCPDCGNLLYPKKDGLFCKLCGDYWQKQSDKLKIEPSRMNIKKDKNIPNKQINKKKN